MRSFLEKFIAVKSTQEGPNSDITIHKQRDHHIPPQHDGQDEGNILSTPVCREQQSADRLKKN